MFVEKEFRRYLDCGYLDNGFARLRCPTCGFERFVAFSCKGRFENSTFQPKSVPCKPQFFAITVP